MKSGNKIYALLLFVIVACFAFFFSTKFWLPDDRTKQNNNYDELLTVGDWSMHLGNARYDSKALTFTATIYQRSSSESPRPYSITVFLRNPDNHKVLISTIEKRKNDPNYETLTVKNVPQNYYYLTVEIKTAGSGYESTSDGSEDEYFNDGSASSSGISETVEDVKIDYRTASETSSGSRKEG